MNVKTPASMVQPMSLQQAIDRLYEVFSRHQAPKYTLDVCTACCMDKADEAAMRRLPLRELTARHFYAYNDSAKSAEQPAPEIQYLLPRLLELLAQGAELHHSTELFLDRLGRCDAAEFSKAERATIDAYALAFFGEGLAHPPSQSKDGFMGDDAFGILLMLEIGGIDIDPLLAYWLEREEPASTMHYVRASYWALGGSGGTANAFASDRPRFHETMGGWLSHPGHRQRFAERILALDRAWVDSACSPCCGVGPCDMLEAVFDSIAP